MSPLPPEVLKELQQEYISSFADKEKAIENALTARDWKSLLQHFHKLAGSGATYSMPEITELCRTVENYLLQTPQPSEKVLVDSISVLKKIFASRKSGESYKLS